MGQVGFFDIANRYAGLDAKNDSLVGENGPQSLLLNQRGNFRGALKVSGANALAETQALSPYFGELYEPFPLIDRLVEALTDKVKRVVLLRDAMRLLCDAEYS